MNPDMNQGQASEQMGQGLDKGFNQMGKSFQRTGQATRNTARNAAYHASNVRLRRGARRGLRGGHGMKQTKKKMKAAGKINSLKAQLKKTRGNIRTTRQQLMKTKNPKRKHQLRTMLIKQQARKRMLQARLMKARIQHAKANTLQHTKRAIHRVTPHRDKDPRPKKHGPIASPKRHIKNIGHRLTHFGHTKNHKHGPIRSPVRHTENMAHRVTHMGRTRNQTIKHQMAQRRKSALASRYKSRQKQDQAGPSGPSLMKGLGR